MFMVFGWIWLVALASTVVSMATGELKTSRAIAWTGVGYVVFCAVVIVISILNENHAVDWISNDNARPYSRELLLSVGAWTFSAAFLFFTWRANRK